MASNVKSNDWEVPVGTSIRKRREAYAHIGNAFRWVHEARHYCEELDMKSAADDLFMVESELIRIRRSIYTPASVVVGRPEQLPLSGPEQLPDSA